MISRKKQQNNTANSRNEKHSLIPLGPRVPIWKINFRSMFFWLSISQKGHKPSCVVENVWGG